MFEKLIEKLYLRQKDNLVYYDPYMNTKTAKFYEDKATDLFDKIICVMGLFLASTKILVFN